MWPPACARVASTLSIGRFRLRITSTRDRLVRVRELTNRNALRFLASCLSFGTLLLVSSSSQSDRGSGASGVPGAAVRHLYREAVLATGELVELQREFQRRRRLHAFLICGSALLVLVSTSFGWTILSLLASTALVGWTAALLWVENTTDAPARDALLADWNRHLDRVCELRLLGTGQPPGARCSRRKMRPVPSS